MPVSYMSILISGPLPREPIRMRPPGWVYLMALVIRLRRTQPPAKQAGQGIRSAMTLPYESSNANV